MHITTISPLWIVRHLRFKDYELHKVYGPYTRKDGRQHVIHYYGNNFRVTQSYPRYLMEQKLDRELEDWEEVDHIDNDPTNNSIDNLQILTQRENQQKEADRRTKEVWDFTCPICGVFFQKEARFVRWNNIVRKKKGPYCSRSCAGKGSYRK